MRKILLNYLRSFKKRYIQMIGAIFFLIILSAMAIGTMTTSLQIQYRTSQIANKTNTWDTYLNQNANSFSDDFLYHYFYQKEAIMEGEVEFLALPSDDENYDFFSPRMRTVLNNVNNNSINIKNNVNIDVASEIRKAISDFSQGSNSNSSISDDDGFLKGNEIFSLDFMKLLTGANSENIYYSRDISLWIAHQIARNSLNRDKVHLSWGHELSIAQNQDFRIGEKNIFYMRNASKREYNTLNGKQISEVVIQHGRNVDSNSTDKKEIVLTDKFARLQNLTIGSKINLLTDWSEGYPTSQEWTVVGIGIKQEDLATSGDFASSGRDHKKFGYGYVNDENIQLIEDQRWENTRIQGQRLSLKKFLNFKTNDANINEIFKIKYLDEFGIYDFDKIEFKPFSNYANQEVLTNVKVQVIMNIFLGLLVISLAFIFITFLIKKEINENRSQIGIFKAFGYSNSSFALIFSIKTFILMAIGIFFGYFLSLPLQMLGFKSFERNIMFFIDQFYTDWLFLIVIWVMVPLFFSAISFLLIWKTVNKNILSMISNGNSIEKKGIKFWKVISIIIFPIFIIQTLSLQYCRFLERRNIGFNWRLRRAFTSNSIGKFVLIMTLFTVSSIVLIMQFQVRVISNDLQPVRGNKFVKGVDHSFEFRDYQQVDFDEKSQKLTWSNPEVYEKTPLTINGYKDEAKFKKALNKNSTNSSDQIRWLLRALNKEAFKNSEFIVSDKEILDPSLNNANIISTLLLGNVEKIDIRKPIDIKEIEKVSIKDINNLRSTLFLLKSINNEGFSNNFYLEDVGITSCLLIEREILKQEANDFYSELLKNRDPEIALKETRIFLDNYIKYQNINCNNKDLWSSWILDLILKSNYSRIQGDTLLDNWENASLYSKEIMQLAMLEKNNYQTIVTSNQLMVNQNKEVLTYTFNANPYNVSQSIDMNLILTNSDRESNESYSNSINDKSLSKTDWNNLSLKSEQNHGVKAIISKLTAKSFNLKKGDSFKIVLKTKNKVIIPIEVAAINNDDIYSHDFIVDYDRFFDEFGDDSLNQSDVKLNNGLLSSKSLFQFADFEEKDFILNSKLTAKSLTLLTDEQSTIFGSIFSDFIDLDLLENNEIFNKKPYLLTDPLNLSSSGNYTNLYYAEAKMGEWFVRNLTVIMNIVSFMIITILAIVMIVLVLVIVDESTMIILTLKSIGYNIFQVNWIVLGDYFVWGFIIFWISYLISSMLSYIFSIFAWKSMGALIGYHISFIIPLATLGILAILIGCGWISSFIKIKGQSIVTITN
ncbi:ABC transporter permease [Spiroplasma endosymbiont of Panorpa germanica]|uniref:ABC transporter permease n=1 Tax=Spiroplasma endosymbiont of Panorpa germanica TaxID=3066314 RepID=UPI0030D61BED